MEKVYDTLCQRRKPEINSALVALSQKTDLDPKALATGAYAVYKMLELAQSEQSYITDEDE